MKTIPLIALLAAAPALAAPAPKKPPPSAKTPEQLEADRHFKSGVALFKETKFAEALAEFERAYEIAPHPLVLYNIAGCHRELSHYAEAVKFYGRFLSEGKGVVPQARLTAAQGELDGILARIARVTVAVDPSDGTRLTLDGNALGTLPLDMPLIVPPGEHKLVAHADGKTDAERTLRVASGDEVDVELKLADLPPSPKEPRTADPREREFSGPIALAKPPRFAFGASFGTNLVRAGDTGAPSIDLGVAVSSRLEIGIDAVLVAYAVMPSVRVRLAGDALSVHLIGAVPISFKDGDMTETFVAGAAGLGLRYRAARSFAIRLDALASFATKGHGTTIPAFLGGELWF